MYNFCFHGVWRRFRAILARFSFSVFLSIEEYREAIKILLNLARIDLKHLQTPWKQKLYTLQEKVSRFYYFFSLILNYSVGSMVIDVFPIQTLITSSNHRLESAAWMHLKSFCLDVGLKAWQKIGVTFDSHQLFDQGRKKARRSRRNVYLLKIEAKCFRDARQVIVRIQKVIWDHLLALKGEIIQKQASFSLPFRTPNNSRVVLIYAVCSVFSFVLFCTSSRSFFRLSHVRKAWN